MPLLFLEEFIVTNRKIITFFSFKMEGNIADFLTAKNMKRRLTSKYKV